MARDHIQPAHGTPADAARVPNKKKPSAEPEGLPIAPQKSEASLQSQDETIAGSRTKQNGIMPASSRHSTSLIVESTVKRFASILPARCASRFPDVSY